MFAAKLLSLFKSIIKDVLNITQIKNKATKYYYKRGPTNINNY